MSTVNSEKLEILLYWISERERIRIAKDSDVAPPWTTDAILAEWRFCNVNRCDDRETKWISENIIAAHSTSSVLWFNLAIARLINWSPTLNILGYFDEWEPHRFKNVITGISGKAYTGAYMIPAGPKGMLKHDYLADCVFTPLWNIRGQTPTVGIMLSHWDKFFRRVPCMGDFLRNQIITDMRYTHHLNGASDWDTFILAGPGTQRGLNRLHDLELSHKWSIESSALALLKLRTSVTLRLPHLTNTFQDINNLSNCMCEYDKYLRVLNKEGTPRSRYATT